MKSYSVQTTIALLGAMAAGTVAVPARGRVSNARKERQLLFDNIDILESNEGGLLAKLWGQNSDAIEPRSGVIMQSIQSSQEEGSLAGAMAGASAQSSKLRGGDLQGSGSLRGKPYGGKGIGKGTVLGYGKACKTKSDKKDKAKGGAKGDKDKTTKGKFLKGDKFPTTRPTAAPTKSFSPSAAPSETQTESPTEEWCHEDYWPSQPQFRPPTIPPTDSPTVTPEPSTSSEPSQSPSSSAAPTVSPAPTKSLAPTTSPTVSPAPTVTPSPTIVGGQPGMEFKSFCQILNVEYNDQFISIWNPALNKPGSTKEGTGALKAAIATPIDSSDTTNYKVSVNFQVKEVEITDAEIARTLDEVVTPPVILEVLGCQAEARATAEAYYVANKIEGRKLEQEEEGATFAAAKNFLCEKSPCSGGFCDVSCETNMNYIGDLDSTGIDDVIFWSIKEYFSMLDDVTSWYPKQALESDAIEIVQTSGPSIDRVNTIDSNQAKQQGMRAAPFIGAATGLLAVLLLMVLFVRKRRYYGQEEISHLKLDDDADNDTFYNGSDGNSDTLHQYNSRDTHIVGEGDSVISHWTGYTGRKAPSVDDYEMSYNRSGLMKGSPADVHQCSSATCEICHEKRMAGVQFVKTGILSPASVGHSIPSDASREYMTEDTVML